MWRLRIIVLIFALFHGLKDAEGQLDYTFNCRTAGCNGVTGACDAAAGTCTQATCNAATPTNLFNFDCNGMNAVTADVSVTCPTVCDGTNTFYCPDDLDKAGCVCNAGFRTGDSSVGCQDLLLSAKCYSDGAEFTFYPYEGTNVHSIHVYDGTAMVHKPACTLTDAAGVYTFTTPATRYDYTTPPSADCIIPVDNPSGTYTFQWYIQQTANIYSTNDVLVLISCTPPTAGTDYTLPSAVSATAAIPNDIFEPAVIAADFDPEVTMHLEAFSALGTPLAALAAVTAGDELIIFFQVPYKHDGTGYITDLGVVTVTVANYDQKVLPVPAGAQSIDLITNGCVDNPLVLDVTKNKIEAGGTPEKGQVTVKFIALYFIDTATGYTAGGTYITATICFNGCPRTGGAACADTSFTDTHLVALSGTTAIRKRRDVGAAPIDRERRDVLVPDTWVGNFSIIVLDPSGKRAGSTDTDVTHTDSSSDCYQSLGFILPVVLLAVMLLFALGMVFYFCTKLSSTRNELVHGSTNMAYKS